MQAHDTQNRFILTLLKLLRLVLVPVFVVLGVLWVVSIGVWMSGFVVVIGSLFGVFSMSAVGLAVWLGSGIICAFGYWSVKRRGRTGD